jgi:hypothetical protein
VQPRERGGKLVAQRYRQRTEADGCRENQPTMDRSRSAELSSAAGAIPKHLSMNDETLCEMAVYSLLKMKTGRGGDRQDEVARFYGRMKEK